MGSGFRSFAFGEVLTSANVQNYLMDQAVTVFAGTAARGSAITSPETGMVSYRTDGTADSKREGFEFYDGSAWTRMIPQGGLTLVKSQTIGSAVSSVEVTGAFSADYENYRIIISGGSASGADSLRMQLGSTTTGYYQFSVFGVYSSSTVNGDNVNNGSTFWVGRAGNNVSGVIDVLQPFASEETVVTFSGATTTTTSSAVAGAGYLNNTTSYTAFTISTQFANTLTGGTIKVYGYRN
jgi:hypothetical protein